MEQNARMAYLETEVKTATPQKLRLLLIEGALRYAMQAQEKAVDDFAAATEPLLRCRAIVAELWSSVKDDNDELTRNVRSIYAFLLRALIDIRTTHDVDNLAKVIEVLSVERDTWQTVCQTTPHAVERQTVTEVTARNESTIPTPDQSHRQSHGKDGVSLDA